MYHLYDYSKQWCEIEQWYNDQAFKYVRSRVWIKGWFSETSQAETTNWNPQLLEQKQIGKGCKL